jgi:hypothetical protein
VFCFGVAYKSRVHSAAKILRPLGYIALAIGVMGIPLLVSMIQSDRERLQRLSAERREIASDDGKIRVNVPGTWTKLPELNKQASQQVGNKHDEVY